MMLSKLKENKDILSIILIAVLAIMLQVQTDLIIKDIVIRIALSDFLLPVFLLYFLFRYYNHLACATNLKEFFMWGCACLAVMSWGMVITFQYADVISNWGLKKIIGWIALGGYFMAGYLIAKIYQRNVFIKYSLITYGSVGLFLLLEFLWVSITRSFFSLGLYKDENCRLCGFFENPNAYGLMGIVVLGICLVYRHYKDNLLNQKVYSFLIIICLLNIFLTTSRGAWVAGLGGILLLLYFRVLSLKFLREIAIACLVMMIFHKVTLLGNMDESRSVQQFNLVNEAMSCSKAMLHINEEKWHEDIGLPSRLKNNMMSLKYWAEKPLLGIGLGTFLIKQERAGNVEVLTGQPAVIYNTFLWLLTEMGILGALVFSYLPCIYIYGTWKVAKYQPSAFVLAMLFTMIILAIASMATEILYQRYLWVFWGMLAHLDFKANKTQ